MKKYAVKNFSFSPMTHGYNLLDTNLAVNSQPITEYFDIIVDSNYSFSLYSFSEGTEILIGEYNYFDEQKLYKLKYALVPKMPGLFMVKHASALAASDHDQSFEGQCQNKGVEFATVVNGDTADNNIHLLLESPDEHWNTWELEKPQERFHNQGGYAFRVVQ